MTSCSSHNQLTSIYPYRDTERQCSTTSLDSTSTSRPSLFSWLRMTFQKSDLPSLPENISHLLFSSPQSLPAQHPPAQPPMSFEPPLSLSEMPLRSSTSDSNWAQVISVGPQLPPSTEVISIVTRMQGFQLHHPHPLIPMTSGTTFPFPSVPTSRLAPLPPSDTLIPITGTSPYKTQSPHQSQNPSPDHPSPAQPLQSDSSGHSPGTRNSLLSRHGSIGNHSPSRSSEHGQMRPTVQIPSLSSFLHGNISTESMGKVPRAASQRSSWLPRRLPTLLMTLTEAIRLFKIGKLIQIPEILFHTSFNKLFTYFAYELLSNPEWATTDARVEYFYFSQHHIPCDNILQGEAS